MCVDMRDGLEGGQWAPNGCPVMVYVFDCLCIGDVRVVRYWAADVMSCKTRSLTLR